MRCPKSLITPESHFLLETFVAWSHSGKQGLWEMNAKIAEAMIVLEEALREEANHGETDK